MQCLNNATGNKSNKFPRLYFKQGFHKMIVGFFDYCLISGNHYLYSGTLKYLFVLIMYTTVSNHSVYPVNGAYESKALTQKFG